jgi:hypothetical protein
VAGTQEIDADDAVVLGAMSAVRAAADGRAVTAGPVTWGADVEAAHAAVASAVVRARAAAGGLERLGPTRFARVKQAALRAARLITHRVVEADRALADGLEALAAVHGEQLAHTRRTNDALRALVVSSDLAIADAIDEARAAAGDPQLAARLAELEARVARLEALVGARSEGVGR